MSLSEKIILVLFYLAVIVGMGALLVFALAGGE